MEKFAELLDQLYYTYSNNEKLRLLTDYFATSSDPDRGYAIAIISRNFSFKYYKRTLIRELIEEHTDAHLFKLSYDYVGDLAETAALLWHWPIEDYSSAALPKLSELVEKLAEPDRNNLKSYVVNLLNKCNVVQRWALLKLATGSLRIGISERFLKQALADYGEQSVQSIEEIWHAIKPPYIELFAWLEKKTEKPLTSNQVYFHPIMLSHPLTDKELIKINPEEFAVEWKYDGIRIQIVSAPAGKALYTRTGDEISQSFPEILDNVNDYLVLDGELVIKLADKLGTFNELQQRLNRKKPTKAQLNQFPAHIILYDLLLINHKDLRPFTFNERREALEQWYHLSKPARASLSPLLNYTTLESLKNLRTQFSLDNQSVIEGLMLKRKASIYVPGRPKGEWYKWKRDPFLVDAIIMYAQRGHGNRSSFYSDYTFGLWKDDSLLPIGKAYFGFTDEELYKLDRWIRNHTINKFGPVREVSKELVVEIAFDAVQKSARHKSGYALRFPRINRIRWDKPAAEADLLTALEELLK